MVLLLVDTGPTATGAVRLSHPLPSPVTAHTLSNVTPTSQSVLSSSMTGVWEGVITGTSTALITWMLSGFGSADGSSAQLSAINSQLEAIQSDLTNINSTLVTIDNDLNRQTCDTIEATDIGPYTSRLSQLWIEYETLLGWNAETGTFATNPDPSVGDIEQWLADATATDQDGYQSDGGYSITTALTNIWTGLDPAGSGAYGTLYDCIKAEADATPAAGTLDDRPYYNSEVVPMEEYYYTYQLEAFEMMGEEYHFQAWQAAGSPTGEAADVESDVCSGSSTSSTTTTTSNGQTASFLCQEVANFVYEGYLQVLDQWAVGGAPFSSSDALLLNGTGLLFAESIQYFTSITSGPACGGPISSSQLCGPLLGPYTMTSLTGTYGGYSDWTAATSAQLDQLINPSLISGSTQADWISGTLASWLSTRGFSTDEGGPYIVLTPTTGLADDLWTNGVEVPTLCFMDTQMTYADSGRQPFCDGASNSGTVAKLTQETSSEDGDIATTTPASWISGLSYNSFYNIDLVNEGGALTWTTSPEWRLTDTAAKEYHWPVINTAGLTCNAGQPATNPDGVPSMCGSNLTAYIASYVPAPPTSASPSLHAEPLPS